MFPSALERAAPIFSQHGPRAGADSWSESGSAKAGGSIDCAHHLSRKQNNVHSGRGGHVRDKRAFAGLV